MGWVAHSFSTSRRARQWDLCGLWVEGMRANNVIPREQSDRGNLLTHHLSHSPKRDKRDKRDLREVAINRKVRAIPFVPIVPYVPITLVTLRGEFPPPYNVIPSEAWESPNGMRLPRRTMSSSQ